MDVMLSTQQNPFRDPDACDGQTDSDSMERTLRGILLSRSVPSATHVASGKYVLVLQPARSLVCTFKSQPAGNYITDTMQSILHRQGSLISQVCTTSDAVPILIRKVQDKI